MITVELYCTKEYSAIILKREKFVAKPALHYFINYTTADMLKTLEVKGAEIDASAWDNDKPTSACFKAPQSLAPSPHIRTTFPKFWYKETILALSLGLVLA